MCGHFLRTMQEVISSYRQAVALERRKTNVPALSRIGASVRVCIVALLQRCCQRNVGATSLQRFTAPFHLSRSCSSCWAFAGTTVLSWRLYIASKGAPPASARSAAVHVTSYTKAYAVHWRTVSTRGFEARA